MAWNRGSPVIRDHQNGTRGDPQSQRRKDGAGAQGGDKGVELYIAHQHTVDEAADGAGCDGAEDAQEAIIGAHHNLGADAAQKGEHTAHAQVDVAGDHYQRQAEGDDAGVGLLAEDTKEVRGGNKGHSGAALGDGQDDLKENDDNHHGDEHCRAVETHKPAPQRAGIFGFCLAHCASPSFPDCAQSGLLPNAQESTCSRVS